MRWQDKLTKEELKHVKEVTDNGLLGQFKAVAAVHKKWRDQGLSEPCFTCKHISYKLGLPVGGGYDK